MKKITTKIHDSLLKREEAINRYNMRRESFLAAKEQITCEFEEARIIWLKTLEQLPIQEFKNKKGNPPRQTVKVNMKSSIVSSFHPINLSIQK